MPHLRVGLERQHEVAPAAVQHCDHPPVVLDTDLALGRRQARRADQPVEQPLEHGVGQRTLSVGSLDHPFNPVSVAIGAEATFVARSIDTEREHLREMIEAAAAHEGAAFIEVYQNCNIFNDGAFEVLKDHPEENQIRLVHGEPIRFGKDMERGIAMSPKARPEIVDVASVGEDNIIVHDAHREDSSFAFMLSRVAHGPTTPTPIGIFRQVQRPVYEDQVQSQVDADIARRGEGDLASLLAGNETWTVSE